MLVKMVKMVKKMIMIKMMMMYFSFIKLCYLTTTTTTTTTHLLHNPTPPDAIKPSFVRPSFRRGGGQQTLVQPADLYGSFKKIEEEQMTNGSLFTEMTSFSSDPSSSSTSLSDSADSESYSHYTTTESSALEQDKQPAPPPPPPLTIGERIKLVKTVSDFRFLKEFINTFIINPKKYDDGAMMKYLLKIYNEEYVYRKEDLDYLLDLNLSLTENECFSERLSGVNVECNALTLSLVLKEIHPSIKEKVFNALEKRLLISPRDLRRKREFIKEAHVVYKAIDEIRIEGALRNMI